MRIITELKEILYAKGLEILESNQGKRSDLEEIEHLLDEGYTPNMIFSWRVMAPNFAKFSEAYFLASGVALILAG